MAVEDLEHHVGEEAGNLCKGVGDACHNATNVSSHVGFAFCSFFSFCISTPHLLFSALAPAKQHPDVAKAEPKWRVELMQESSHYLQQKRISDIQISAGLMKLMNQ